MEGSQGVQGAWLHRTRAGQELALAAEELLPGKTSQELFLCQMLLSSAQGWDTPSLGTSGHSFVAGLMGPE